MGGFQRKSGGTHIFLESNRLTGTVSKPHLDLVTLGNTDKVPSDAVACLTNEHEAAMHFSSAGVSTCLVSHEADAKSAPLRLDWLFSFCNTPGMARISLQSRYPFRKSRQRHDAIFPLLTSPRRTYPGLPTICRYPAACAENGCFNICGPNRLGFKSRLSVSPRPRSTTNESVTWF